MMIFNNKQLKKWVLYGVGLMVVTSAIATQSQSSVANNTSQKILISSSQVAQSKASTSAIYRNLRLGFQFNYSRKDFVVDDTGKVPPRSNNPFTIEIWTHQDAQKIRSGAYEGGTEYPANVSIRVFRNPNKLSLQNWVEQSNQFGIVGKFKNTKISGRNAIAFQSSGLYENENVVFSSPNGYRIIVISFAKTNYGNHDVIYQKAFDQVVNSFAFLRR